MRIVIDTNLWISAVISPKMRTRLLDILKVSSIMLLIDKELKDEIKDVISRPKLKKYVKTENIDLLINAINLRSTTISVISKIKVCRDEKDDFLLALCKDGAVDFLITGDKDLLVLNPFENTQILTLTAFEEIL